MNDLPCSRIRWTDAKGRGVFSLVELIAACITTIDVIVIYSLLQLRKGRLVLALWTAVLNMAFPFIGFFMGHLTLNLFSVWSNLLSGVLLALIGIQMILQNDDSELLNRQLHPFFIALAVSLDTFSVSVSFGMLQLNKLLFIIASGSLSFIFACIALLIRNRFGTRYRNILRKLAGAALLIMGILSCIR